MRRSTEKVQVLQGLQEQHHPGGGAAIIVPFLTSFLRINPSTARLCIVAMAAIILVLNSGCSTQPVVEPEPRVVRVEVPVPVPCRVEAPAVPAWAAAGLRKGDSLEVKVRALLAERRQAKGYITELQAATTSCQ